MTCTMISGTDFLTSIPLLALYAETHYRPFRFFPSLVFRKTPEVIFDAPRRVGPQEDVPVSLIINDVRRYPVVVESVSVSVTKPGGGGSRCFRFDKPEEYRILHPLSSHAHAYLFRISRSEVGAYGCVYLNGCACLRLGKKIIDVFNDNLPLSGRLPLQCRLSDEPLPASDRCLYGDVHTHTQFSQSHVEFGPPVAIIAAMARAYGLSFFALTDHSYDLACMVEDYLCEDPLTVRWELLQQSIRKASTDGNPIIICGEEVSCLNSRQKAIHALALGTHRFIAGSMDGARLVKKHKQRHTIASAAAEARSQGGIFIAAHPRYRFGFWQKIVLRRGIWEREDFASDIDGLQAVNGSFGRAWEGAKQLWVRELLKGRRLPLLAGNDCHGDFNRYRFLHTPFLSIGEDTSRYFGNTCTGVYGKPGSSREVIESIRDGRTFVTSGPFLDLELSAEPYRSIVGNARCSSSIGCRGITVHGVSSEEFGPIVRLRLLFGSIGQRVETTLLSENYARHEHRFIVRKEIGTSNLGGPGYLRAELACLSDDGKYSLAYTSPSYYNW